MERVDLGRVMRSHWLGGCRGLPLASAGLITQATNRSSHHNSKNVLAHIASHGSETPSSVSLLRSNWLPHLGNRLIISNMTKSNAPKNSRKAANNSTALGRYKQASLLLSVKRLLLLGQLVLTEILMRNLQASQLDWVPEILRKRHLTATRNATEWYGVPPCSLPSDPSYCTVHNKP